MKLGAPLLNYNRKLSRKGVITTPESRYLTMNHTRSGNC